MKKMSRAASEEASELPLLHKVHLFGLELNAASDQAVINTIHVVKALQMFHSL